MEGAPVSVASADTEDKGPGDKVRHMHVRIRVLKLFRIRRHMHAE